MRRCCLRRWKRCARGLGAPLSQHAPLCPTHSSPQWDQQWEALEMSLVVYRSHFLAPGAPSEFCRPKYCPLPARRCTPWRAMRPRPVSAGCSPPPSSHCSKGPRPCALLYGERACLRCSDAWPGGGVDDEQHLLFECESTQLCVTPTGSSSTALPHGPSAVSWLTRHPSCRQLCAGLLCSCASINLLKRAV